MLSPAAIRYAASRSEIYDAATATEILSRKQDHLRETCVELANSCLARTSRKIQILISLELGKIQSIYAAIEYAEWREKAITTKRQVTYLKHENDLPDVLHTIPQHVCARMERYYNNRMFDFCAFQTSNLLYVSDMSTEFRNRLRASNIIPHVPLRMERPAIKDLIKGLITSANIVTMNPPTELGVLLAMLAPETPMCKILLFDRTFGQEYRQEILALCEWLRIYGLILPTTIA